MHLGSRDATYCAVSVCISPSKCTLVPLLLRHPCLPGLNEASLLETWKNASASKGGDGIYLDPNQPRDNSDDRRLTLPVEQRNASSNHCVSLDAYSPVSISNEASIFLGVMILASKTLLKGAPATYKAFLGEYKLFAFKMDNEGPVGLGKTEYAQRTKALISVIGDVRALGGQGDLDLPRIAVIGNQSAGKSSLIEAISGGKRDVYQVIVFIFVVCPMECRLKHSGSLWQCQVLLRIEIDSFGNQLPEIGETEFGPIVYDTHELERMLRRAQLAILNPGTMPDRFVDLDPDSIPGDIPPFGSNQQLAFSSNVICLDVSGPGVPDLSFIDLPGKDTGNIDAVKNMIMKHIQGNCLILLTITMRDDIDNQSAAFLAKTVDPSGVRTIGVLTKPDTLQSGEENYWKDVLEGRRHPLVHGYYITKQPAPKELEENITHGEARRRENNFFKSHKIWSTCDSSTRSRMGTINLGQSLSKLLSQVIDKTLPSLRAQVAEQRKATESELSALPARLGQLPMVELINSISAYCGELTLYVHGGPGFEDLIQRCTPAYRRFSKRIRRTAPVFIAKSKREASDLEQSLQAPEFSPGLFRDEEIVTSWTKTSPFILRTFGRELNAVILGCFNTWDCLALESFETVFLATQEKALSRLEHHFGRFSYSSLNEKVKSIVLEEMKRCKEEVTAKLSWIISLRTLPTPRTNITLLLIETNISRNIGANAPNGPPCPAAEQALAFLRAAGYDINSAEELIKLEKPDEFEREMTVAAEARAYFQIAYKVPYYRYDSENYRSQFVAALAGRIQKALYAELLIGTDKGRELAERFMADDPTVASRREELEAKAASIVIVKYVRQRLDAWEIVRTCEDRSQYGGKHRCYSLSNLSSCTFSLPLSGNKMARGRGRGGPKRGGGHAFSRHLELDENGVAVSQDPKWAPRGDAQEGDSSGENESTDEESGGEEVTPAPARKARKQQGAQAKKAESDEDEDDADLVNPNRVPSKNLKAADLAAPRQLSRREREEKEKKEAQERYWKLHAAGKTDQAKADLGRLAAIRKEREAAALKRKAEQEAKAAELEGKKAASGQKR
ncbi:hypothetical protein BS47DRAFT_1389871 [Hydnum rufescens UP504]|uniref:Dynamin-type G domain-containing protein n=1 Tax=Hydnum rufescens UP504 TaxID=1448309 RepID=A0A9P6E0P9_9AGAM|nr:hypothetical protein BS47DRAFT_1389871 [Hydnum rufescens UP504]